MSIDFRLFSPSVLQVYPTDDYSIYLYFNDGTVRHFDVKPYIKEGTVFAPLKDIRIFKEKITIINETVAWDLVGNRDEYQCIDLDPIELYQSPIVDDPLEDKVN